MKPDRREKPFATAPGAWRHWMAFPLLVGVASHFFLGWQAIRAQSATFDEPLHLTAGYAYATTRNYKLNGLHHPPLSSLLSTAPLLVLKPDLSTDDPRWVFQRWENPANQYGFAHDFLYGNSRVSHRRLLTAGRAAVLAVSCLFTVVLFAAALSLYGVPAAWTAFVAAVFCPTFLAHGSLVTTDFLFGVFYFLFFWLWHRWEKAPSHGAAVLCGAALGLAFCSKFSAVAVAPVLAVYLLFKKFRLPFSFKQVGLFVLSAAAAVALVYQFKGLPLFWQGLAYTVQRVQEGRATFFWGRHGTEGWWYYFPVLFMVKTPIPILLGAVAANFLTIRRKLTWPWFLWWPPLAYFLLACQSSVQIGHRHILPFYPFLYMALGGVAQYAWRSRWARAAALGGGIWLAAGAWRASPYYLAYFNEAMGGREKAAFRVTDSNIDWGQGLPALKNYMDQQGVDHIYLSYFGTADPGAHGISYTSVAPYNVIALPDTALDISGQKRQLMAVSATNLQSTYFRDTRLFDWLKKRRPEAFLGASLFVYDISDGESRSRLSAIFQLMGRPELAARLGTPS